MKNDIKKLIVYKFKGCYWERAKAVEYINDIPIRIYRINQYYRTNNGYFTIYKSHGDSETAWENCQILFRLKLDNYDIFETISIDDDIKRKEIDDLYYDKKIDTRG